MEGSEFEVVLGALPVIEKISSWVIEMHDIPEILSGERHSRERISKRSKDMDRLLRELGYSTSWVDDRWVFAERKN